MKGSIIIIFTVLYFILIYYFCNIIPSIYDKIGFSIYKQCIFDSRYKKFNGKIIGRKQYTTKTEIEYFYQNYDYRCEIDNIDFLKYKNFILNSKG